LVKEIATDPNSVIHQVSDLILKTDATTSSSVSFIVSKAAEIVKDLSSRSDVALSEADELFRSSGSGPESVASKVEELVKDLLTDPSTSEPTSSNSNQDQDVTQGAELLSLPNHIPSSSRTESDTALSQLSSMPQSMVLPDGVTVTESVVDLIAESTDLKFSFSDSKPTPREPSKNEIEDDLQENTSRISLERTNTNPRRNEGIKDLLNSISTGSEEEIPDKVFGCKYIDYYMDVYLFQINSITIDVNYFL
jgi:hypothetical protein